MIRRTAAFLVCSGISVAADNWPQFRGPEGKGIGDDSTKPPVEFGPSKGLLWKKAMSEGHSSPCVWGDQIFLTAFEKSGNKLHVIALKRSDGSELWRRTVVPKKLEKPHPVSNPAASTPVTDGKSVYAYFGSHGLVAYAMDGKPKWETTLPVAEAAYGAATSPVLANGLVIIGRDYGKKPELLAFSQETGKSVWRTELSPATTPGPQTSHATPVVFRDQVVLHRPGQLAAYSLKDGERQWWITLQSQGTSTPVVAGDTIYVAAFFNWGEPELVPKFPSHSELLAKYDKNEDGKLSKEEIADKLYVIERPGVPETIEGANVKLSRFWSFIDANKNDVLDPSELDGLTTMTKMMGSRQHGLTAVKPEGTGDITATAVKWVERKNIPEVPAPLYYQGRVYMVMNGGVLTCMDASTGKVLHRARVDAPGAYFSAPVAADGRVYVASAEGVITVLKDGESPTILTHNDLGDPIYATPALIGSTMYVRSANALWAFRSGK